FEVTVPRLGKVVVRPEARGLHADDAGARTLTAASAASNERTVRDFKQQLIGRHPPNLYASLRAIEAGIAKGGAIASTTTRGFCRIGLDHRRGQPLTSSRCAAHSVLRSCSPSGGRPFTSCVRAGSPRQETALLPYIRFTEKCRSPR